MKLIKGLTERWVESLVREIDQDEVQRDVGKLRSEKPQASREEIAAILTKKAAVRAATTGAAAGAVGGPIALLAMGPDILNLVRQQSRLVLAISFLYEHKAEPAERIREVLATLALSAGASFARKGIAQSVERNLASAATGKIARKLTTRYIARRLPTLAPIVGSAFGAAVNYMSVKTTGAAAVRYYSKLAQEREAAGRLPE